MNTTDNKNTIGERIKNFRSDSLHMTQRDFAEELGLQPSTLSGYEKGNIIPSTDILLKIARKYNLSLDWLCGLTNNAFQFNDLGEIVDALIKLNDLNEIRYEIERNKPDMETPENRWWCSLKFYGMDSQHPHNGSICSFLDSFYENRSEYESYFESLESYNHWKNSTIEYYSGSALTQKEYEDIDYDTRIARRNELIEKNQKK